MKRFGNDHRASQTTSELINAAVAVESHLFGVLVPTRSYCQQASVARNIQTSTIIISVDVGQQRTHNSALFAAHYS